MKLLWSCLALALLSASLQGREAGDVGALVDDINHMAPDPERSFHVRDIELVRGDIKIYLNEGSISFLTPVAGKAVAAIFSTQAVEAGDAELIVLPPQRNERAALAAFTKTPNLDEHFSAALFLFTDSTAQELITAINDHPLHKAPEFAAQVTESAETLVRGLGQDMRNRLAAGLLDAHRPENGFFYALIGGKTLGNFEVTFNPFDPEQVTIGREHASAFSLWTSFRARRTGAYKPPEPQISRYRIQAEIGSDLNLKAEAVMNWTAAPENGRVIPLRLAGKLSVDSAQVDGKNAQVLQSPDSGPRMIDMEDPIYLISDASIAPGAHELRVTYHGSVIRRTDDGSYFVDDRNAWYPFALPIRAIFDLTFSCPSSLRLVSTGELVSDEVKGETRTVHRVTQVPEALAGFNLGDYEVASEEHGRYRIESYANKGEAAHQEAMISEAAALLDFYSNRWMQLPIHGLAVSPIPATFGQGFPGLIYLSDLSYVAAEDRPLKLQTPEYERFFSDLLLPHEVAHQWWGNLVGAADYRSAWIMEALANYSALQFVAKTDGAKETDALLDQYRNNLVRLANGKPVESYGPLEFGVRLADLGNAGIWHTILYEKGTWVMQMLHQRLGDEGFLKLQARLLHDYANRPITNEDFRQAASALIPPGQPDKSLTSFFETWVYGTGIPKIELKGSEIAVSGVDDDFTMDLPLSCESKPAGAAIRWVRVDSGTTSLDLPPGNTCHLPEANEFLYISAQ